MAEGGRQTVEEPRSEIGSRKKNRLEPAIIGVLGIPLQRLLSFRRDIHLRFWNITDSLVSTVHRLRKLQDGFCDGNDNVMLLLDRLIISSELLSFIWSQQGMQCLLTLFS